VAGWFLGGPIADWLGRRWGMAIGCFITIIATFIQTFSPRGQLGCFIGGRVVIGLGQGIALSVYSTSPFAAPLTPMCSCRACLYW
jgi:MFS family permease